MLKQMLSYPKLERFEGRDIWFINAFTYLTYEKQKIDQESCCCHILTYSVLSIVS